jgi:peptidoglycan/LPS O-acetylase OafA/YrhL
MKEYYNSLDLAKFICAIMIIELHTGPLSFFGSNIGAVERGIITIIAVPFFFVVSGFLFLKKVNSIDTDDKKNRAFFS